MELKGQHSGSIKCIVNLERGGFASGGNDGKICIWDSDGTLQNVMMRHEEESERIFSISLPIFRYFLLFFVDFFDRFALFIADFRE